MVSNEYYDKLKSLILKRKEKAEMLQSKKEVLIKLNDEIDSLEKDIQELDKRITVNIPITKYNDNPRLIKKIKFFSNRSCCIYFNRPIDTNEDEEQFKKQLADAYERKKID